MCVKNIYLFLFTYNNRIDRVFFMFGYKSENMVCIIAIIIILYLHQIICA